ncbi:MAG: NAD(P)/FAD-dependent oxidoreductase [Eubacterium sp.]|nr:NAD(P)/FAD-dependent oxidoreductase [Eubacterium sp.]
MSEKKTLLLQPIQIGPLTLKNRVMFPPLTTGYEERDGSIGEQSFHFYERLAKGGTSYVVIGDVAPVNTASPTPKLCDDRQIPSFQKLADALHAYDCKLALQLFHPEYDVPGVGRLIMGSMAAAKEAEAAKAAGNMELFEQKMAESGEIRGKAYAKLRHDMHYFVTEATVEQLAEIKQAIADCAVRAKKAGVDAIEVHGDRLLGSLCSKDLNHREDAYGGSLENRVRYALEVVAAIKGAVPDLMLEYKLPIITVNADGSQRGKGGLLPKEAKQFAVMLEQAGVDMLQVAQANHTGNMGDTIPPMGTVPYNWVLPVAAEIKKLVSIPIATVGRVVTAEAGEQILQEGSADVIGYGRSLLTDPDFARKAETGEPIRTCLNCNKGCVDAIQNRQYLSCVLNAENGNEASVSIRPGNGVKKIAVVGAGIAGLEAARVAAKRGYMVTVYDKAKKMGGQILLAAVPPRKSEILRAVEYYEQILPVLGVEVKLGQEPDQEELNKADAVIAAVGAYNVIPPIPGADAANVVSAWDILAGEKKVTGRCAVIGGGLVGTETAEYLLEQGCTVSIVEMLDQIAAGESSTILPIIEKDFKDHGVQQYTQTKVTAITPQGITAVHTQTEEAVTIPCDYVVMAVGSRKISFSTEGITVPVLFAGDCSGEKTAGIAEAVRSGYHAANGI